MRSLKTKVAATLVVAAAAFGTAPSAWALGTAAGTDIDNRASITYSVSGVAQTLIESAPGAGNSTPGATFGTDTTFEVDDLVDLTLTNQDGANISVAPAQTGAVTEFLLTNTGNAPHDYRLVPSNGGVPPYGGVDNFNAAGLLVFVESGVTVGYQAAQDTAIFVNALAGDGTATIYVLGDIPAGQVTTDLAVVTLTTITADSLTGGLDGDTSETVGADNPAVVDVVFGDAGTDGLEAAQGAYEVQTASLTISKSSAVISDPFNLGVNPKAIPGAIIEYTVTISNAGPATATSVTVTDDLSTEIGLGTISFNAAAYGGGLGMRVTAPNINGGATLDLTNVAADDEGDFNVSGANTVTVSGIDLSTGQSATVTYQVTITYP